MTDTGAPSSNSTPNLPPPSPSPPVLPPGVGVTVWTDAQRRDPDALRRAVLSARADLELIRPAIVCLHTTPGDEDRSALDALRSILPDVRVWVGVPANGYADDDPTTLRAVGERWALWCEANGVECVLVNAEAGAPRRDPATSKITGRGPGWVIYHDECPGPSTREQFAQQKAKLAALDERLRRLYDGAGSRSFKGVALGITSHDLPATHPLPPCAYTHPLVALVAPQVYPAEGTDPAKWISVKGFEGRRALAERSWRRWSELGHVRPDLMPGSPRWAVYAQLWGLTAGATARALDRSPVSLAWTLPRLPVGRAQPQGIAGAAVAARARVQAGGGPGAIRRAQVALGARSIDGDAGPETARLLGGLPWPEAPAPKP